MIFIQEDIPFDIFELFIESIITKEIDINQDNYDSYYYLSHKYGYEELQSEIEDFIQNRPDLVLSISQLAKTAKSSQYDQPDLIKEEIIAKNIDISITNGNLYKLPLQMLNRILNSPKRVIKDHRLLFSFVIETIKKYESKNMSNEEIENLSILPSCLDYMEMTSSEIEELFDVEKKNSFFSPKNSDKRIKAFISSEREMKEKCDAIATDYNSRIKNLEKTLLELMDARKNEVDKRLKKIEELQNESISKQQTMEKKIDSNNSKIVANEEEVNKFRIQENKRAEDNETVQERINDDIQLIKKSLMEIKNKIDQNVDIKVIEYNGKEFDGIIKYLNDQAGGNIHDKGIINVTSNSIDKQQYHPKNLLSSDSNEYRSEVKNKNATVYFDFMNYEVEISKYSIKSSGFGINKGNIKNWVLEISNDENNWIKIDEQSDYAELIECRIIKTFNISQSNFARFVRFRHCGDFWGNGIWNYTLKINQIEFYGRLIKK